MTLLAKGLVGSLYILAAAALLGGAYLSEVYNIGTNFASEVPTATQTVKVCHNSCRYLAPEIAFRLHLGLGLFAAGGLMLVVLINWKRFVGED